MGSLYEHGSRFNSSTVDVVVGGQYGSEGKGAVAGAIIARYHAQGKRPISVRIGGPNAGHTVVGPDGTHWALRQVPVGAVASPDGLLVIASGSEIDPEVLAAEVEALEAAGISVSDRLIIDSQATVIDQSHKNAEADLPGRIGSTGKGIGAARAARLMREAYIAAEVYNDEGPELVGLNVVENTANEIRDAAGEDAPIVIEGTQGYGLGLHAGHYPYCTSGDVRAIDALPHVGLAPWDPHVSKVIPWVVMRAYPIRVAGNSGPLAKETTWEELNLPVEKTTVTKKVRRVGLWDHALAAESIIGNGSTVNVAVTMVDHVDQSIAGMTNELPNGALDRSWQWDMDMPLGAIDWLSGICRDWPTTAHLAYIGTGPGTRIWL